MDGVTIRAARPDDAADVAAYMAQPSVVWGTLQLPLQSADHGPAAAGHAGVG